jgi:hypothetical protein
VPKSAVAPNELPLCTNALVPVGVMNDEVSAFCAQLAVPNSEPVIPLEADIIDAVKDVATLSDLSEASDPDTITFFHDGI